jgi:hypothetical protein
MAETVQLVILISGSVLAHIKPRIGRLKERCNLPTPPLQVKSLRRIIPQNKR